MWTASQIKDLARDHSCDSAGRHWTSLECVNGGGSGIWTVIQIKDLASPHSRYPHLHPHCLTYTGPINTRRDLRNLRVRNRTSAFLAQSGPFRAFRKAYRSAPG